MVVERGYVETLRVLSAPLSRCVPKYEARWGRGKNSVFAHANIISIATCARIYLILQKLS